MGEVERPRLYRTLRSFLVPQMRMPMVFVVVPAPEHVVDESDAAVNDMLRLPRQAPAVGILVCGSRNERTVRYALDGSAQPLTVTSYTYEALPADEQAT